MSLKERFCRLDPLDRQAIVGVVPRGDIAALDYRVTRCEVRAAANARRRAAWIAQLAKFY